MVSLLLSCSAVISSLWQNPVYYYYYYYWYNYSLRVFQISIILWSMEFEWQQVSSSLQDSTKYSGRSQPWMVFLIPSPPVLVPILWWLYKVLQLQLVSPSLSCFTSCFSFLARSTYFIIIYSLRVFHISFSWWSFTGGWVTASRLKSPGFFSVFWPFSIM